MTIFSDAECADCGEEIKDGERVIVSTVCGGYYRATDGTVEFDCDYIENEIRHKQCWMKKDSSDAQLPESLGDDGSIAISERR